MVIFPLPLQKWNGVTRIYYPDQKVTFANVLRTETAFRIYDEYASNFRTLQFPMNALPQTAKELEALAETEWNKNTDTIKNFFTYVCFLLKSSRFNTNFFLHWF